ESPAAAIPNPATTGVRSCANPGPSDRPMRNRGISGEGSRMGALRGRPKIYHPASPGASPPERLGSSADVPLTGGPARHILHSPRPSVCGWRGGFMEYSISPEGEKFPLPTSEDAAKEFARLQALTQAERAKGREIVVVVGVGFVGAVMAAVVADSTDKKTGQPGKFVIGMQRPSTRSYWKIPLLNRGLSPVKSEDPEVDVLIQRCVRERRNLVATYTEDALKLADCV